MNALSQNTKITVSDINTLISECNDKLNSSGGNITGSFTFFNNWGDNIGEIGGNISTNNNCLRITGGEGNYDKSGGVIQLFNRSHSSKAGFVEIKTDNGTNTYTLTLTPTGTLTWDGNNVITSAGGTMSGTLTVPTPFTIKAQDSANEGGELCLKNPNSTYPIETRIDNYRNTTRIIAIDTSQSKVVDTVTFSHDNHTLSLNGYNVLTTASGKAVESAKADYATTYLDSLGQKTSITSSGTTGNSTSDEILYRGLSVFGCYNTSGCPSNYGNIVQVKDARSQPGGGQLFLGWSGTDSTTEKCYYRSHRDTTGGGWGPWRELYMANTLSEVAFANGSKLWIA